MDGRCHEREGACSREGGRGGGGGGPRGSGSEAAAVPWAEEKRGGNRQWLEHKEASARPEGRRPQAVGPEGLREPVGWVGGRA
jgi:hypothetical protein